MKQGYIEVRISFEDYMEERKGGKWGESTSKEDVLMSMFRERGVRMDGDKDMKPVPPVEIITDDVNHVFIIKQWNSEG
jgi:hypothetical protein